MNQKPLTKESLDRLASILSEATIPEEHMKELIAKEENGYVFVMTKQGDCVFMCPKQVYEEIKS